VAQHVESSFAEAGIMVCSNASAYRDKPDVPLLLPEVNPDHTGLLNTQRSERNWLGGIVTNPNCTSTGVTIALKALHSTFGVTKAFAVSLQALSGAGYPGVPSMDIIDNVVPYIGSEEDKVEQEPLKMLGELDAGGVKLADLTISAHTNRVAVSDGHTVCLSIKLAQLAELNEVADALANYKAPEISRHLPFAPHPVILVREEPDRPQPRLDRMTGKGMTTVVGRLRPDPLFDLKLVVLSHNTIRGAAGGSIYNAELLVRQGFVA
jgi:aspartate-semialdehyde dehydrogenase